MSVRTSSRPRDRPGTVLHVLDGPCLRIDGRPAAVPESSLRLLVFLAFRRRPAARRTVAGTLWSDAGEARAGGNLRSAIWRLRGAGVAVTETAAAGLTLGPEVTIDLTALTGWAARVTGDAPPADDDLAVPDDADAALDLLPGWYDDWVVVERERVRTCVLHALEQVSRRLSATGRHAQAVDAAIAAVCADPLRESAQRALIRAHLAEGNLVEAQRTFRAYRELLADELGVAPPAELWQLIAAARIGHLPTAAVR
jgi:DNA-binding SARP family transcriptional activator